MNGPLLVVAPHPDDEVLGPGGTVLRARAAGDDVHVVIVTSATPPQYDAAFLERSRKEAAAAHAAMDVTESHFLDFPAAALDTVPRHEVNAALGRVLSAVRPATVLVPFPGDMHNDHAVVFEAAMVGCRPTAEWTPTVLAYETLSETNWNAPYIAPSFTPTTFVDISDFLTAKLEAMGCYAEQLREPPHERSLASIESLARLRGSTVGVMAAEAFVLIRQRIQ